MADRQTLFDAVERLRAQREQRSQEMANFMQGLSGSGQIGFGIGRGLQRLFSDGTDSEMLQARQMEQAMAGINYNDPASLEAARAAVSAISPESGMAFDQYLLNRMATQRDIQAKDLEMALKAQEAITAANAVPEGSQWKVTDAAANSLAKNLVDRGMITPEQAPMISAQIQHQSSVYGGDVPTILKRLGLGGQPQQDQYGSVNSGRNVDTSVQP